MCGFLANLILKLILLAHAWDAHALRLLLLLLLLQWLPGDFTRVVGNCLTSESRVSVSLLGT